MPQNITDASTWTTPIVMPADTDPADLAYIETAVQGLANRTTYLKAERDRMAPYIGGAAGTDEWEYETPKTRVVMLSLASGFIYTANTSSSGANTVDPHWALITYEEMRSRRDFGNIIFPLNPVLVQGCDILRVRAVVDPGTSRATAGNRMKVTLKKTTVDLSTPGVGTTADMTSGWRDDGTGNLQVISSGASGAIELTCNIYTVDHYLSVLAGDDAGTSFDKLHAIELTIREYGPRRF